MKFTPGGPVGSFLSKLVLVGAGLLLLSITQTTRAELIPAPRVTDWTPGVSVGVIGGIPKTRTHLLDVTKAPFNADNTGATDTVTAIQNAIDSSAAEDIVYLPAGTYRINSAIRVPWGKSNITIRGDGPALTHIDSHSAGGALGVGQDFINEDWPQPIPTSHAKGATVITIPNIEWTLNAKSMPARGIGSVVLFSVLNNMDPNNLVVSVAGFERMRNFMAVITSVSADTITIAQPLPFDLPASLQPQASFDNHFVSRVGVESLHIDGINAISPFQVGFTQSINCWFKDVKVTNSHNYLMAFGSSMNCEMRGCDMRTRVGGGTNGAGLIMGRAYNCLVEDNIIADIFPHMEINGSCTGNVFAYNFLQNNDVFGVMGPSIDANHGPHCSFNLYEGNISSKFQCDGYFGSASEDTLFRNWFHGTCETTDQTGYCIVLNRFTRKYNVVGNILGRDNPKPGVKFPTYIYESRNDGTNGQDGNYDGVGNERRIYVLGTPNIGNGGYLPYEPPLSPNRFAQPSAGKWWAKWPGTKMVRRGAFNSGSVYSVGDVVDYTAFGGNGTTGNCLQWQAKNAAKNGLSTWTTPAPDSTDWAPLSANSFQEIDLDVPGTLLRKGNYNYATNSIPSGEALGSDTLPSSLFRGETKPGWFGDRPWPAFDPLNPGDLQFDRIPAGYRFVHGTNPPSSKTDEVPPSVPAGVTAVVKSPTSVTVTWQASTDDTAVAGYKILRAEGSNPTVFAPVASTSQTSFTDDGLVSSTVYSYKIEAVDTEGNTSSDSNAATGTTLKRPAAPKGLRQIK